MNGIRCKQRGDLSPQCASNQDLKVCLEVSCCRAFDLPPAHSTTSRQERHSQPIVKIFPCNFVSQKNAITCRHEQDGKYVCYVLVGAVFTMHNSDLPMQCCSTTQATMPATHAHDCQTCSAAAPPKSPCQRHMHMTVRHAVHRWQKSNDLDFPRLQRTSRYFPSSNR
jgi:hypothetical protein